MVDKIKSESGSVLVFALILMLLVSVTGVTLSVVLLNEVKSSQNIDQSLKAYYAAESGLEYSLDYLMDERLDKSSSLDTALITLDATEEDLENEANYSLSLADDLIDLSFPLAAGQIQQIDLIDPDDSMKSLGIEEINIDWLQDCPTAGENSRIEVSLIEWIETTWQDPSDSDLSIKNIYTCGGESPTEDFNCKATEVNPADGYNYQLRIKSLDCDLPLVQVSLEDSSGNEIVIPGRARIKSTGLFGRTKQALSVDLPWRILTNPLGDYVLFSETDLEKL